MENQQLVPIQKILADFNISKTALYNYIASQKINIAKQNGNFSFVSQEDFAKIAKNYKKRAKKSQPQVAVQVAVATDGKVASKQADPEMLQKQNETLQYQIKEYAERFIDMKQRAEELKIDKEQFASKRDEARQKIEVLSSKNSKLSVMTAIFGVLFLVCLVAICLFFFLR